MRNHFEPIEVDNSIENIEYPTRISITDLNGNFEHAGNYSAPKYSFSVKVHIEYNKIVGGKEENLIKVSFWTIERETILSFNDDDLSEDDVEDWFWEGLSEDLSNHDLEELEKIDFYAMGVPTNKWDECDNNVESYLEDALGEELCDKFRYSCSDLYSKDIEPISWEKELVIEDGDCKTIWSIEDFDYDRDYENDINVSFTIGCLFIIKENVLFYFEYETEKEFFTNASQNIYEKIVKEIEERDFCDIVGIDKDDNMNSFCHSFEEFVVEMDGYDSFEERIKDYISDEVFEPDNEIEIRLGDIAKKWIEDYEQMSDLQRKSYSCDFNKEAEEVTEKLFSIMQSIRKKVEDAPDDEYEDYVEDILDNEFYAIGICYCEGMYYICFGDMFGMEIEYQVYGHKSHLPFTKEEIKEYVNNIYWQMLS